MLAAISFSALIGSVWGLFIDWLRIFWLPFADFNMIWIIVPIWLSWFFTEFFQEKKGTSFGNAISNGAVPLWVAIDWLRFLTQGIVEVGMPLTGDLLIKYAVAVTCLMYGFTIIIYGIKAKDFVHKAGRIRTVTYILLVFTPFIYGEFNPTIGFFLSILLFFPVFYGLVELLDRITPEPEFFQYDEGKF